MLAASKSRPGGKSYFSLCSAASRSLKKRSSSRPPASSSECPFFPKARMSTIPHQLLGLPAIYSHQHLHGPRQENSVSPLSLFLTLQYLVKSFLPPSHCPSPFSLHYLCFSVTLENLCFQNYSCPPAFAFWLPSNLPSV